MKRAAFLLLLLSVLWIGSATAGSDLKKHGKGLYAVVDTDMGVIVLRLFEDKTPNTVANFVGLATGTKEYIHPIDKTKVKKRFYDGRLWHRVIPDFMIQTGCPLDQGGYEAGYTFNDEIREDLTFNKPGMVAMANRGPNSNSCQWFITETAQPHLNGKMTIFGEVVEGMDTVGKIARVPTSGEWNKPVNPIRIKKLDIVREE